MSWIKLLCYLTIIFLLSGCASLTKEECMSVSWYELGYEDGERGHSRSRFNNYSKDCAKHHIQARREPYMLGRKNGLRRYCMPQNGLREGLNGSYYGNVCPAAMERGFLRKYRQGKNIYEVKQEIKEHESRIDDLKDKLSDKKEKLSKKERKRYKREIRDLRIRIEEKNKHLNYLKRQAGV